MYIRRKKIGKNRYFYLEASARVQNKEHPITIHVDYLGSVKEAKEGKCPKCRNKKTIYPKYDVCRNCLVKIPELKKKFEIRKKRYRS